MFLQLSPRERFGYVVVVGIAIGGISLVGARHLRQPAPIIFESASKPLTAQQGPEPSPVEPAEVVVHVIGEVKEPGLRRLPLGSRIHDAIKAAGGALPSANLGSVNLAAKLLDGSQVYVEAKRLAGPAATVSRAPAASRRRVSSPRPLTGTIEPVRVEMPLEYQGALAVRAEEAPSTKPAVGAARGSRRSPSKVLPAPGSVSLNSATAAELQSLPGVGPSTAAKILEYRKATGGFSSLEELMEVKGIGPKKLEAIRRFVRL